MLGTVIAPTVAFTVGLYPLIRDRLERAIAAREQRIRQERDFMQRTEPWGDRWAGPRIVLARSAAPATTAIALRGWVDLRRVRAPFTLTVSVAGTSVGRYTVTKSGRFVARLPLVVPLEPGAYDVEVGASDWWTPGRDLRNGDFRPLAWKVYHVGFHGAESLPSLGRPAGEPAHQASEAAASVGTV
jgi:hypothetical protein